MQYKLIKPFTFGKETISEVTIKEDYDTGDMIQILNAKQQGDGEAFGALVSVGTQLPLPEAKLISAKDAMKISAIVNGFLDLGEM